jgi:hypothetical protein
VAALAAATADTPCGKGFAAGGGPIVAIKLCNETTQ